MTSRSASMFVQAARSGAALVVVLSLPACGGGTQSLFPELPKWSLTDKGPSGLGRATGEEGPAAAQTPYEYHGGRDPVTGRARAPEGQPKAVEAPPAAAGTKAASLEPDGHRLRTIEVHKGDTLHGLSLQYHVSVKTLMEANNLATTTIIPGKRLLVPPAHD